MHVRPFFSSPILKSALLSFELHVYLIEVMESMSKGLLFATKLIIVALAV